MPMGIKVEEGWAAERRVARKLAQAGARVAVEESHVPSPPETEACSEQESRRRFDRDDRAVVDAREVLGRSPAERTRLDDHFRGRASEHVIYDRAPATLAVEGFG